MYKVNIKPVRIVVLLSTQKQNNVVPYQGNITIRDWSKSMVGWGGWARSFGNVVDKKLMAHPLPSVQK